MLASVVLLGNGGDADAELRERVLAIQKRYDAVTSLRGSFVQESLVASIGRRETSRGSVAVQRPGRMRWEYSEPQRQVITVDRETVRIWVPADDQLQIAPARAGALSPTALDFLFGASDLLERFEARPADPAHAAEGEREGLAGLKLVPREDAGFESLELWTDARTHALRESVIADLFGNRTRVTFSELVENEGVSEEHFRIDVPDGTEIIDLR